MSSKVSKYDDEGKNDESNKSELKEKDDEGKNDPSNKSDEWKDNKLHGLDGGLALHIDQFINSTLFYDNFENQKDYSYNCLKLLLNNNNINKNNLNVIENNNGKTYGYCLDSFVLQKIFEECIANESIIYDNRLSKCLPEYFCTCCHNSFNKDVEYDGFCSSCMEYAFFTSNGKQKTDTKDKHMLHIKQCNFYTDLQKDLNIISNIFASYRSKMRIFLNIKKEYMGSIKHVKDVSFNQRLSFSKICFDILKNDNFGQYQYKYQYKSNYKGNANRRGRGGGYSGRGYQYNQHRNYNNNENQRGRGGGYNNNRGRGGGYRYNKRRNYNNNNDRNYNRYNNQSNRPNNQQNGPKYQQQQSQNIQYHSQSNNNICTYFFNNGWCKYGNNCPNNHNY